MNDYGMGLAHMERAGEDEQPQVCPGCNGSLEIEVRFGSVVIHTIDCPACTDEES